MLAWPNIQPAARSSRGANFEQRSRKREQHVQQFECGLCGRRFMSEAQSPACPSCGVAAAVPVAPAQAPEPASAPAPAAAVEMASAETASAALVMESITSDASGASEETTVVAQSTDAQFVETETQAAAPAE